MSIYPLATPAEDLRASRFLSFAFSLLFPFDPFPVTGFAQRVLEPLLLVLEPLNCS